LDQQKPKLNLPDNFWVWTPTTTFHWSLFISFRDEVWGWQTDRHTYMATPLCVHFMHRMHILFTCSFPRYFTFSAQVEVVLPGTMYGVCRSELTKGVVKDGCATVQSSLCQIW